MIEQKVVETIVQKASAITQKRFYKNGIEIEKGVILTVDRIEKNRELYEYWCNLFTAYPDLYIDLITPSDSYFKLFFYQRIFLRACLRYRYHYCVAPRAFSKTFVSVLSLILKCIFQPGTKTFLCAPKKERTFLAPCRRKAA